MDSNVLIHYDDNDGNEYLSWNPVFVELSLSEAMSALLPTLASQLIKARLKFSVSMGPLNITWTSRPSTGC